MRSTETQETFAVQPGLGGAAVGRPGGRSLGTSIRASGKGAAEESRPATVLGLPLRWPLVLGGGLVFSLAFIGLSLLQSLAEKEPVLWSNVFSDLLSWYLWALLFPAIWWVGSRFRFERRNWRSTLAIHLGAGVLAASAYRFLDLIKRELVTNIAIALKKKEPFFEAFDGLSFNFLGDYFFFLRYGFQIPLIIYFGIVAAIHAVSYYEKFRDRELKATRLEAQLAQSQLQVLKMQLHPHFLFNTLNAISALMHRDVEAADKMITLLSDLLRVSLEKDERHLVPVQNELEFLGRYLAIEKIRFRDRLRVEMDIEPGCLDAQVPKLILQPLVENAIRHGIAMRSAAGLVSVEATRKGGRLRLVVSDDGPGLPADPSRTREGVGLANTRGRLEQLYGEDHHFELRPSAFGGFEVVLEMPFEEKARYSLETVA